MEEKQIQALGKVIAGMEENKYRRGEKLNAGIEEINRYAGKVNKGIGENKFKHGKN